MVNALHHPVYAPYESRQAVIHVKALTIFRDAQPILQDISFTINRSEFIFLTGATGSGKTSLMQTLYADIPIQVGDVQIVGFDLRTIKKSKIPFLRRKIGIIFQDFQLLMDRNVEDNLWFVLKAIGWKQKKMMRQKITEVLMQVGLDWASKKLIHQLSGGEQQRVAIARALLNDPLILLADEPTGNLDPEVAHGILDLFMDINRGGTAVLMATHNYNLLEKYPKRVLSCCDGTLTNTQPATALS